MNNNLLDVENIKGENEFVFIEKDNVFTNSKIIAEGAGIKHRYIKESVRKNTKDLEFFGKLLVVYATESSGGRREEFYNLNEQQATFLITLLKNTEQVKLFKRELVRQFYLMKEELLKRKMIMPEYKYKRKSLTDVIKNLPDSPHKRFKYNQYTDLAYKALFGFNSKQLKAARNSDPEESAIECLTSEEVKNVALLQEKIGALIELGVDYKGIKEILNKKYNSTDE